MLKWTISFINFIDSSRKTQGIVITPGTWNREDVQVLYAATKFHGWIVESIKSEKISHYVITHQE
jgi:hypothetical protein